MNFDSLQQQIEAATKKAFTEMVEQHGTEEICAFALYSDEGAMTVCPSTNTQQHLATAEPDDLPYAQFEPAEWKYEMQGADKEFNAICDLLRHELEMVEDDDESFIQFRRNLYNTCIAVLEKLKQEQFFRQIVGKDIFSTFSVSDYDFETDELVAIITRLNDDEYKTAYLDWMATWN
jgi:hypothetical protein